MTTSADLRGFAYALEPVRKHRQWQLDASIARLGDLRRELAECDARRDALQSECAAQAQGAGNLWGHRRDPATHGLLLGHLVALLQRKAQAERQAEALTHQINRQREQCAQLQRKLELLDQHRADAVQAYVLDQHRKSAAQADRDWSARDSHRLREKIA